jgi:hypothetical protein
MSSDELVAPLGVALERLERRDAHDRQVVARELVLAEQLADLELDELEDLLVVDHVGLVERHDDVGDADLAGQEHVLLRLRHRAVGRRDHEDRAVHLGRAGDHVLDVVGVPGAVDVRVVARLVWYSTCAMEIVMPRAFSSGALSIWSNGVKGLRSGSRRAAPW